MGKHYRYHENILDQFYVTLPSDSFGHYVPANTIADFRTKLATLLELEHDKLEDGQVKISYPKWCKKALFALYTSFRFGGNHISFKVLINCF